MSAWQTPTKIVHSTLFIVNEFHPHAVWVSMCSRIPYTLVGCTWLRMETDLMMRSSVRAIKSDSLSGLSVTRSKGADQELRMMSRKMRRDVYFCSCREKTVWGKIFSFLTFFLTKITKKCLSLIKIEIKNCLKITHDSVSDSVTCENLSHSWSLPVFFSQFLSDGLKINNYFPQALPHSFIASIYVSSRFRYNWIPHPEICKSVNLDGRMVCSGLLVLVYTPHFNARKHWCRCVSPR